MSDAPSINDHRDMREIRSQSPSAHNTLHISDEGQAKLWAVLATIMGCCALGGVMVMAIMLPDLIEAKTEKSMAAANQKASYAERDARVAIDGLSTMQIELAKKNIYVRTDGH